jgi:hypothetical protein
LLLTNLSLYPSVQGLLFSVTSVWIFVSSIYVAVVDHDISGLHVPCFQKFFQNIKNFFICVQHLKGPNDHTDTPDRESARIVIVFCLLI